MTTASVEFLFDYASPFAYLASETLARKLPGVAITYVPIYLRGLESFATGIPYVAAKMMYVMKDLARCAAYEEVPIAIPRVFPINGLQAVRGATWVLREAPARFAAFHQAMFRAAWKDGRPVGDRAVVIEVAREAGVDGDALAAGLDDPSIKDALKAATERAKARGTFGVPTYFVGDELFWGADRLDHVARELARRDA